MQDHRRSQPEGRHRQDGDHPQSGLPPSRASESACCSSDTDPQGDLTKSLGWKAPDSLETTLADHLAAVIAGEP